MSKLKDKVQAKSPYNDGWTRQYYEDKLAEDIVDDKEKRYVYESPDGGKTIFKRKSGETEREEVTEEQWKEYNRNR